MCDLFFHPFLGWSKLFLSLTILRKWPHSFALLCTWIFSFTVQTNAQEVAVDEPAHSQMKRYEMESHASSNNRSFEKQDISWQEIGPFNKPNEGEIGGNAIPTYAAGRGNGIGRITALYIHPRHSSTLFACSSTGGVFASHDKGKQWHSAGTDQLNQSGVGCMALHHRKVNWWVAATGDSENNTRACDNVVFTSDGGKSFQSIVGKDLSSALPINNSSSGASGDFFVRKVSWDHQNPNRLWVISNRGLWLCDDLEINRKGRLKGNITWKRVLDGDFYDFAVITKGKQSVWYVSGRSVFYATGNPNEWKLMEESGLNREELGKTIRFTIQAHRFLPNFLIVSGTSEGTVNESSESISVFYLLDAKKHSWQRLHSSAADNVGLSNVRPRAWAVHPSDPNFIVLGDVHPVFFSSDGGKVFKKSVTNQMHDDVHCFVFSPDGKIIYAAHDGGVGMSIDGGIQWSDRSNGLACANIFDMQLHPSGSGEILYGAYDTGINSLNDVTHKHHIWGDGFDCAYVNNAENRLAVIQNGRFFRSDSLGRFEYGRTPNARTEWKSNMAVHPTDNNCIIIPGSIMKRSMDGGMSWVPIVNHLPDSSECMIYDVFISPFSKSTAVAYGFNPDRMQRPRLFLSTNIIEANAARVIWIEIPALPINGFITGLVFHPIMPDQFWVLTSNVTSTGKCWFYDGRAFTDESSNLGNARCESMAINTASMTIIIGSDQGVFCRSLHNTKFSCYTGYPGCQVKTMAIDYRKSYLYIGTFGRGIWRCDLKVIQPIN
jgi:hypothetical protein